MSAHLEAKQELLTALNQVIADLETVDDGAIPEAGLLGLRLETLSEAALLNGDIPLEVIDLMNQARQLCNNIDSSSSFRSYEAPVLREGGQRGRPKFDINEEQLRFFKGISIYNSIFIIRVAHGIFFFLRFVTADLIL